MDRALLQNVSLDDKYRLTSGRAYMSGIEALVRLLIIQKQRDMAQGISTAGFVSGYRGSPLGGLDQALWQASAYLDEHKIVFQPGINEDLAMTAVRGSQEVNLYNDALFQGVFGMWYGKGPGLDRSMDVLKHANAVGTSKYGGVLAVVGDDHACKSSTLPHQCEHSFMAASAPVLNPSNTQEILDLGIYGWELSRFCGCWVGFKVITENCDASASVDVSPDRIKVIIPSDFKMPDDGVHARWPDTPLAQEERLNLYKIYAAREFARVNNLNSIRIDSPRARFGIITTGKAYLDVLQALEDLGISELKAAEIGLRVLKVGMPWPLEPVSTHHFANGLEEILVVEEKRSIIEDQLTGQLYNWPVDKRPRVVGEFDEDGKPLLTNLSELTPAMVARAIASRIRRFYQGSDMLRRLAFFDDKERSLAKPREIIQRTPHFCSGCPHNRSTVVPEGSRAMGGIGCHYMVTWMDRNTNTFTQMGGEGTTWIGQAPFTSTKHIFQNLGDGTYFHSGILALRAAVAAKVNITYKILYNDAVAMTGGQPIDGSLSVAQITQQLEGEGVGKIVIVSDAPEKFTPGQDISSDIEVFHRDDLDAVQQQLRETPGCTVLIYEQTCAAEKRRRRKKGQLIDPPRRVFINDKVCEGCGDCGVKSNCLSILPMETELGRKRKIDQSACNKDFSCLNGFCPSFVTIEGGILRKHKSSISYDTTALPTVTLPDNKRPWNIVITGIGGTGVLTVSSILGMAAHLENKGCTVLNLSGLAQKFGPVVSHVRIAQNQDDIYAARVAAGDADLLLGCDLVVSASEEPLAKVNINRSHAVINSYESATAAFTREPDMIFPSHAMRQKISEEVSPERTHFIDATAISTELLGDAIAANMFLLGFAYQQGLVAVSAEAINKAIELNAVAVKFNQQAFNLGRIAAVDITQIERQATAQTAATSASLAINELISHRADYLRDYQNEHWSKRYRHQLERVKAASSVLGEHYAESINRAVAESLFRLMSYKDEYEVARLYVEPKFKENIRLQFDEGYRLQYHFAAPLLSRRDKQTGHLIKRGYGQWIEPLLSILSKLKFLRGGAFDVFGYTAERHMERALINNYDDFLDELCTHINSDNFSYYLTRAKQPQSIRGYGHIKLAHIDKFNKTKKEPEAHTSSSS